MNAADWFQLGSFAVVLAALGVSAYQVRLASIQTRTLARTLQQTAREIWEPMRSFYASVFTHYVDELMRRNPVPGAG